MHMYTIKRACRKSCCELVTCDVSDIGTDSHPKSDPPPSPNESHSPPSESLIAASVCTIQSFHCSLAATVA